MDGAEEDRVARYRERITELDRLIMDAVNRRLALVAELKAYKDEHGIGFVDAGREQAMLAERLAENDGPLSEEGLRAFHAELLALMKRELG
jgi:chorismate mutase